MPGTGTRYQHSSRPRRPSPLPPYEKPYRRAATFDPPYPPPRRSRRLAASDYDDYNYDYGNQSYYDNHDSHQQEKSRNRSRGTSSSGSSLAHRLAPPNPLPQFADPEERAYRKKKEKEAGGFSWEEGLTLALTAAAAAFSVDKRLRKAREEESQVQKRGGRSPSGGGSGRARSDVRKKQRGGGKGEGVAVTGFPGGGNSAGAPKGDWYYGEEVGAGGRAFGRSGTW